MGMIVECSNCHAKFAGKAEFAGRRIRCPKCQSVFRVPAEGVPAAEAAVVAKIAPELSASAPSPPPRPPQTPARPKNKYAGMEIDEWNVPEDFEYTVTEEVDHNAGRCVYCHAEMQPGEVLCLACGYNRKLGQKMTTKSGDEALADEAREAARNAISFAGFAVPKNVLIVTAAGAAAFALLLYLVFPLGLAILLLMGGSLLMMVGHIWVIVAAFQESAMHGLLVWFLPIYWYVYVFNRWEEIQLPFIIWAAGTMMIAAALGIGWSLISSEPAASLTLWQLAAACA